MTDKQERINLSDDSERLYERGLLVSHCSDDGGLPDVGISVGLGGGMMLYAGDRPGRSGWAVAIYPMQGESIHIAEGVEPEAGVCMVEAVVAAIAGANGSTRAALAEAQAEVARLREALRPMVTHAIERCSDAPEWTPRDQVTCILTIKQLRAARAAYKGEKG